MGDQVFAIIACNSFTLTNHHFRVMNAQHGQQKLSLGSWYQYNPADLDLEPIPEAPSTTPPCPQSPGLMSRKFAGPHYGQLITGHQLARYIVMHEYFNLYKKGDVTSGYVSASLNN
jgi:hypothetical protein